MICLVYILTVLGLVDHVDPITVYRLIFKTCDVEHADTNASAYLMLLGEGGATTKTVLIGGGPDKFNRGSLDEVNKTLDFDGPVCAVKIHRGHAGNKESWKLQWFNVVYSAGNANFTINDCETEDDWMEENDQKYTRMVHGNWGLWGPWTQAWEHIECLRHRYRACDNPAPICGGSQCIGNSSQMKCECSSSTSVQTVYVTTAPQTDNFYLTVWMVFAGFLSPVMSVFFLIVIFYCSRLHTRTSNAEQKNYAEEGGKRLEANHLRVVNELPQENREEDLTSDVSEAETRMLGPASTQQEIPQISLYSPTRTVI